MTVVVDGSLAELDADSLAATRDEAAAELGRYAERNLRINIARGVPNREQLEESGALLSLPGPNDYSAEDGTDCRTYGGGARGLPEARRLFAPLVGTSAERTIVAGNSSIALVYDTLGFALAHTVPDGRRPWREEPVVRFLCPVPGYDFHFNLLADHGIEMVSVPLMGEGPDLDEVERAATDPAIKGLIGVPRFSNPSGETYNADCIRRLARMETAAPDFRLFLDNAYAVHHLGDDAAAPLANIVEACERAGHPNRAIVFASTSKITLPGAGLAVMGSSQANIDWFANHAGKRSIGPDKINQLRHVRFLKDWQGIMRLMARHARHLAPKFAAIENAFERILGNDRRFGHWTRPSGGYFISLYTPPGCAKATIERAGKAGVILTPAGSAYPHGVDPDDHHIRIAPTSLTPEQAEFAGSVVAYALRVSVCNSELMRRGLSNAP